MDLAEILALVVGLAALVACKWMAWRSACKR